VLLRREGWAINQKKTRHVYRELGLQLRARRPSAGSRPSCANDPTPVLEPRFTFHGPTSWRCWICNEVGFPATIRVDQGSEFVSRDLDVWAYQRGVTLGSRPGKPTENAFIEAFNGRFRAEYLNAHWFLSIADARKKVDPRKTD
jgi:putative transposase